MLNTIRLFRAVPIQNKALNRQNLDFLKRTISEGFVFSDTVLGNYSDIDLEISLQTVKKEIGLNATQLNSSFHKSWQKVRDASIEQLVIEQIIHYFTTYGFEALGIYNKESVYIPNEALEIPDIKLEQIQLTVINGYTKEELKEKLLTLVNSGIALSEDTVRDVIEVALFVSLSSQEIEGLKNKEVKATLYDYLSLVPENPIEFLRFIVFKATDSALLIKDVKTIEAIREKKNLDVLGLFEKYRDKYGLEKLAEIFYRFKPLLLAFRTNSGLKRIINKIRRLAVKHHKPMPENYLNTITEKLKHNVPIGEGALEIELSKSNIFRKIRLAYALKFRTANTDSILYKIRNGKGFATSFEFTNQKGAQNILDIVLDSVVKDITKKVKGKKIYIPENIVYSLPASEKQFTGMFPSGTCVTIPKDMVFGVHWENVRGHRIDLDLSLLSADEKYGWDSSYRNEDKILFSGDITDAPKPNGASELFYVKKQEESASLMVVNYYNHEEEVEVPINIFTAHEAITSMKQNYIVNPNNIVVTTQSKINQKQKILGIVITTLNECRFYFSETNAGTSITSNTGGFAEKARKYLFAFYTNTISLNEVLKQAGAELVKDKVVADIDLSPASLNKNSIIDLIK